MTGYVALLRGVNLVGKSTLKMADLKAIAEELGLDRPRTFIASGNLLFASSEPEEKLRRMLEKRLQAHMGKDVRVMLRTADEMEAVVQANARMQGADDLPGARTLVFVLGLRVQLTEQRLRLRRKLLQRNGAADREEIGRIA